MSITSPQFRGYDDYYVPLLRLLAALPGGKGRTRDVQDEFWRCHQSSIPPEHRVIIRDGKEEKWRNVLDWSRNELKKRGLLDMPEFGVWQITQAGRDWLTQNPDSTHLDSGVRRSAARSASRVPARHPRSKPLPHRTSDIPGGITLEKLQLLRQKLSAEEFQRDWGAAYDALLAKRRGDPVSVVSDAQILGAIRELIDRVHFYLRGSSDFEPKLDDLCDWAYFCKLLRFDSEARVLTVIAFVSNAFDPDPNSQARTGRVNDLLEVDGRLWTKGIKSRWPVLGHFLWFYMLSDLKKQRAVEPLSPEKEDTYRLYEKEWNALCVDANTSVDEQAVLRLARKEIAAIRRCARQQMASFPVASVLADWIYLSYMFGMYPEGAALWQFIPQDGLDLWRYERVKKLAGVCQLRANHP